MESWFRRNKKINQPHVPCDAWVPGTWPCNLYCFLPRTKSLPPFTVACLWLLPSEVTLQICVAWLLRLPLSSVPIMKHVELSRNFQIFHDMTPLSIIYVFQAKYIHSLSLIWLYFPFHLSHNLGCCNKIPVPGYLQLRTFVSHSYGGWDCNSNMPVNVVRSWAYFGFWRQSLTTLSRIALNLLCSPRLPWT